MAIKPFPIMKLPTELRLRIYHYTLVFDTPIELSSDLKYRDRCQIIKHYASEVSPRLRLLRTSHVVQKEAAPVFYGSNHFYFMRASGWWDLADFMLAIGNRNVGYLKHLAVHVPWHGKMRVTHGAMHSQASEDYVLWLFSQAPDNLREARKWDIAAMRAVGADRGTSFAATYCLRALAQAGALQSLQLILPSYLEIDFASLGAADTVSRRLVLLMKGRGLCITLVHLRYPHGTSRWADAQDGLPWEAAAMVAQGRGWKETEVRYDVKAIEEESLGAWFVECDAPKRLEQRESEG